MVSLVLKRSFDRFEGVDTWFWKQREIRKGGGGGIAMNLTGTKFICFSHFFAFVVCGLVLGH